ncbi:MAG: hypothetical protein AB7S78_09870 [Candidatus Omnitrophota bacterium]
MRNQFMSMRWLLILMCVAVMAGGCEKSGKKLKLPSLEGAPEQLGAPSK